MAHCPVGFRPTTSELVALRRAQEDLGISRSRLIRCAVSEWLYSQQQRGCISKGTAGAFAKAGTTTHSSL